MRLSGFPKQLHLGAQLAVAQRTLDGELECLELHGLGDEVVGARADRPDRDVERRVPGDDDDEGVRSAAHDPLAELETRHRRHLQIGNHDVEALGGDERERRLGRRHRAHVAARFTQARLEIKAHLDIVGGKGASLARLVQAGFPVPPGFTLTTAAYAAFVTENALTDKIATLVAGLKHDDLADLDQRTLALRTLVEQGDLPAPLRTAIEQHYRLLGDEVRVAVRSSATAEDLPDASFAGQHDTYLDVKTLDGIVDAVKRCWASLWTARATSYRNTQHIEHLEVGVAVVIQQMVDAEVAGVLFTANYLS